MISYKDSGVDIDAGNSFVEAIKPFVAATKRSECIGSIGSFSGAFALPSGYKEPVMLAATDGVGTKLRLAIDYGKLDSVGIDLVAMCVNDLICNFGEPLFFLDYYATGALDIESAKSVVKGISEGCKLSECALIGGETAEMPSMYAKGDFDLAGFAVGIAEKSQIDRRNFVSKGDVLVALPSSGLHSNGFSLARAVIKKRGLELSSNFGSKTLGELLLEPTRIYVKEFKALKESISALAHITGGGIVENLPRVLPAGLGAVVDESVIKKPEIYDIFEGQVELSELRRTFNCGVGMVLVVPKDKVDNVLANSDGYIIGEIISGNGVSYK